MSDAGQEQGKSDDIERARITELKPSGIIKRVLILVAVVGLMMGGITSLGLYWMDKILHQRQSFSGHTFEIEKGDTLKRFTAQLQQAGVVDELYSFALYARYKGLAGKLHTGHYQFKDGLNLIEVLDAITSGKYRLSHSFTFVQGSTFKQLRASLASTETVQQTLGVKTDAQVLALFDSSQQYSYSEGLFFPETYAFDPGASDQDILQRAYTVMQTTLAELWVARDPEIEIDTPYEALILASIIEKETALASERKQISGVFMNRLKKGMKLQTDPTVIYGLGDNYDGNITRKHLTSDTPYNTYTRHGLPPTPISMPGRAAIEAALHPATTEAIYFVARGDGSGGHNFSKTLSEHNKAVKKYLKTRRKAG
jgi:UPF0755 protein